MPLRVFADDFVFRGDSAAGILDDSNTHYDFPAQEKLIHSYTVEFEGIEDPDKLARIKKKFGDCWLDQIETSAGLLTAFTYNPIDARLYLKDKEIASGAEATLLQAYPEKASLPSIVLASILSDEGGATSEKFFQWVYLVDVGVSPPYVSSEYLPLHTGHTAANGRSYHVKHPLLIKKGPHPDTYLITGDSFKEHDKKGTPLFVTYIYDRKAGTLRKVK